MTTQNGQKEMGRIEKRAIEAMAVVSIMKVLARRFGEEEALNILTEANETEAFQRGESQRKKLGNTGIPELVEDVATWGIGGEMEIEVLEQTATTYFFNVTRCPYYEKYKELGLLEYGFAFSCCRDEPFARGFHPGLRLERSKTIMEGDEYCDFRFILDSGD